MGEFFYISMIYDNVEMYDIFNFNVVHICLID